jgi:hypothetical protein
MNIKDIAKQILKESDKLQNGDHAEQQFGKQLAAIAAKMEAHYEASHHPITADEAQAMVEANENLAKQIEKRRVF